MPRKRDIIIYPCDDCGNEGLVKVQKTNGKLCECTLCGHLQDIPSATELEIYTANQVGEDDEY